MASVKVIPGNAYLHRETIAECNLKQYCIPLPNQAHNFVEIISKVTIEAKYELSLQILSQAKTQMLISDYYRVQEELMRYFNISLDIDFADLSLRLLSQSDSLLKDLDLLQFKDILLLVKKSYDSLSEKIHSKVNRRLKKYIKTSSRSEEQKAKLMLLLNAIKDLSSEQEEEYSKNQIKQGKKVKTQQQTSQSNTLQKTSQAQEKQSDQAEFKGHTNLYKKNKQAHYTEHTQKKEHNQPRKDRPRRSKKQDELLEAASNVNKIEANEDQGEWIDVKHNSKNIGSKPNKKYREALTNRREQDGHKDSTEKQVTNDQQEGSKRQVQKQQNKGKKWINNAVGNKNNPYRDRNDSKGSRNQSRQGNNHGKNKKDLRVLLGLNGDTDEGWRRRARPTKLPKNYGVQLNNFSNRQDRQNSDNRNKSYASQSQSQKRYVQSNASKSNNSSSLNASINVNQSGIVRLHQTQTQSDKVAHKAQTQEQATGMRRVFCYPEQGKTFHFVKGKEYNLYVNKHFWVKVSPSKNQVVIQKDGKGYIREGAVDFDDDTTVMAEGISIVMGGLCNLQDGGHQFGEPVFEDFLPTGKPHFKVTNLQVYAQ